MSATATVISQMIAPFAVLCLLLLGYGALRRRLPGNAAASVVLGFVFGLVATGMMWMPISPVEGLIIDMRNLPVLLAGAFLGLRGALVAAGVAISVRLGIGGVGAPAGVAAILIVGVVGLAWDRLTASAHLRGWPALLALGAAMNLHLLGVLLLPADLAGWFAIHALPWFLLVNTATAPILARLLDEERIRMLREGRLRLSIWNKVAGSFLDERGLALRLARSMDAPAFRGGAEVLCLRLHRGSVQAMLWGAEVEGHVLAAVRHRLDGVLPPHSEVARLRDDLFVTFLPRQIGAPSDLAARVLSAVGSDKVEVAGMAAVPMRLSVVQGAFDHVPDLEQVRALAARTDLRHALLIGATPEPATTQARRPIGQDRLFNIADRLLDYEAERRDGGAAAP